MRQRCYWALLFVTLFAACSSLGASIPKQIAIANEAIKVMADITGVLYEERKITAQEAQNVVDALKYSLDALDDIEELMQSDYSGALARMNTLLASLAKLKLYLDGKKGVQT